MTELRRMLDDPMRAAGDLAVLRSADLDAPSDRAREAAELALGLGAAAGIGTALGAAASKGGLGAGATKAAIAWTTIAKISAAVVVTAGTVSVSTVLVARLDESTAPASVVPREAPTNASALPVSPMPSGSSGHVARPTPVPEETATAVNDLPRAPAPKPAKSAKPRASEKAPSTTASAHTASRLDDETARVDGARQKLAGGDLAGAIAAVRAYEREFPSGMLLPEALALELDAHVAAHDGASARHVARRYLALFPNGAAATRARRSIENASTGDQNERATP